MNAKINLRQYLTFIKPRNFDTANIKCFTMVCETNQMGKRALQREFNETLTLLFRIKILSISISVFAFMGNIRPIGRLLI